MCEEDFTLKRKTPEYRKNRLFQRNFRNRITEKSGAGGSRTLVQTRQIKAFYMLISILIVGRRRAKSDQPWAYLLFISESVRRKLHPILT